MCKTDRQREEEREHESAHVCCCAFREVTFWVWFLLSIMWVQGTKLRL